METLHFTTHISAPKEKVWETMLSNETFREWTSAFAPDSHFVGSWDEGSEIRFLASDENGQQNGMIATIAENRPYEFISIKHFGIIDKGVEDTTSDEVKDWAGALENYTFRETEDGRTEVIVDMDTEEEYRDMFQELWPKALEKLKELAEA